MSNNLSPEQRLTALVLAAPRKCDDPEVVYCALYRAFIVLHSDWATNYTPCSLADFARRELGFSTSEALGIMAGWDSADKQPECITASGDFAEFSRGVAIGARVHALAHGEA